LTKPVADAVSRRLDDLGQLSATVILDADPEVYRLGFGDQEALDAIRAASAKNLFRPTGTARRPDRRRDFRHHDDDLLAGFEEHRGRVDLV
jgi:hypothetical protein